MPLITDWQSTPVMMNGCVVGRAFMLGPWLASARKLGGSATDCVDTQIEGDIGHCSDFMEWNARAQLTTWYPVIGSASAVRPSPYRHLSIDICLPACLLVVCLVGLIASRV